MSRAFGLAVASASLIALVLPGAPRADEHRITGPVMHENLAVYFIHGPSAAGPVPLTLQEALVKGVVRVHETGRVSELAIENLGAEEVFVQSGDIVKGGQQDRVLTVSLLLPGKSGRVSIASFCVEQGRWTPRGREDARTFSSSNNAIPSRAARLAIRAPTAAPAPVTITGRNSFTADPQTEVWRSVSTVQRKLNDNIGAPVAAPQSATSLQLSLENEKLKAAQDAFIAALQGAGEQDADIIGYAFAINGKLHGAEIYPSNGLFRKMWAKLLSAHVTEALTDKDAAAEPAPAVEAVQAFLAAAQRGAAIEKDLTAMVLLETRDSDGAIYAETRRSAGGFVHRSYLAK